MCELHNNDKTVKYKQLTAVERRKIEAHLGEGKSISWISRELTHSKSTIFGEIKRGKYNGKYKAHIAQNHAEKHRRCLHKHCNWRNYNLLIFIETRLKNVGAMGERIWTNFFTYEHLYSDKKHRPNWSNYLICKGKKYKRTTSLAEKCKIPNRVDIVKREEIVEKRVRFGDFDVDTVISARGGKSCIAVSADRMTRTYFLQKMPDKTAEHMFLATMKTLKNLPVKTMTYDNGTENVYHEQVNNILNCKIYFCRSYCSGDKGFVENWNKILRQFLPKGTNFDMVSEGEIRKIQDEINGKPMKVLGRLSPLSSASPLRSGCCFNVQI